MKVTVESPIRADHRVIRRLLTATYGGDVTPKGDEYLKVASVFAKAGGSWEKLFLGSAKDLGLLKRVLRVAYKTGHLTKSNE